MSKSDYYAVGDIMHRKNGKAYEVVSSSEYRCCECAFTKKSMEWCGKVKCQDHERHDGNDVSFVRRKKLDKVKLSKDSQYGI